MIHEIRSLVRRISPPARRRVAMRRNCDSAVISVTDSLEQRALLSGDSVGIVEIAAADGMVLIQTSKSDHGGDVWISIDLDNDGTVDINVPAHEDQITLIGAGDMIDPNTVKQSTIVVTETFVDENGNQQTLSSNMDLEIPGVEVVNPTIIDIVVDEDGGLSAALDTSLSIGTTSVEVRAAGSTDWIDIGEVGDVFFVDLTDITDFDPDTEYEIQMTTVWQDTTVVGGAIPAVSPSTAAADTEADDSAPEGTDDTSDISTEPLPADTDTATEDESIADPEVYEDTYDGMDDIDTTVDDVYAGDSYDPLIEEDEAILDDLFAEDDSVYV